MTQEVDDDPVHTSGAEPCRPGIGILGLFWILLYSTSFAQNMLGTFLVHEHHTLPIYYFIINININININIIIIVVVSRLSINLRQANN